MDAGLGEVMSLAALRRAGETNPAVRLLAVAATEMRGGADFAQTGADPVAGALLAGEAPVALRDDALARTLARIEDAGARDQKAAEQAMQDGQHAAELLDLPPAVRDARPSGAEDAGLELRRLWHSAPAAAGLRPGDHRAGARRAGVRRG